MVAYRYQVDASHQVSAAKACKIYDFSNCCIYWSEIVKFVTFKPTELFLHFDAVFGKARVLLLQEEKPYVIALYVVVYKY